MIVFLPQPWPWAIPGRPSHDLARKGPSSWGPQYGSILRCFSCWVTCPTLTLPWLSEICAIDNSCRSHIMQCASLQLVQHARSFEHSSLPKFGTTRFEDKQLRGYSLFGVGASPPVSVTLKGWTRHLTCWHMFTNIVLVNIYIQSYIHMYVMFINC